MSGLRVAVVGAGPAGMYAVGHLLERGGAAVRVDVFERLATPWGLVRSGVAPDHPEKKLIADRLFDFSLHDPRVRFFGNVEIGSGISHPDLSANYHAVVYAVGAGSDLRMHIPGEDLPGCFAARSFVAFYNGHPDFQDLRFDLSSPRAVIVGNGNVALDIARILCTPVEELAKTDIADKALDILRHSAVQEVVLLARRGPAEAAFNNPELEELGHLPNVDIVVDGQALPDRLAIDGWEKQRKLGLLAQLSRRPSKGAKRIVFRFLASPLEVIGTRLVTGLRVGENALYADPSGVWQARPTGRDDLIETGLIFRAIGYRGVRFPGLPFDERSGTIPNIDGRVIYGDGERLAGAYVTGWIKRGCRGIIGTNRNCAHRTVDNILEDLQSSMGLPTLPAEDPAAALLCMGRSKPVSRAGWLMIDRHERDNGRRQQRSRVKITDQQEQLALAMSTPDGLMKESS